MKDEGGETQDDKTQDTRGEGPEENIEHPPPPEGYGGTSRTINIEVTSDLRLLTHFQASGLVSCVLRLAVLSLKKIFRRHRHPIGFPDFG
jgi:hypothetical protein